MIVSAMTKSILLAVVAIAGSEVVARADLAATQYVGHGIAPVDAPTIRMVSAKVDIVWGEPGTLSAVFVMNNEAAEAADVQLGFPVSLPEQFRNKEGLDFTMTFDGVPIDRAAVRQDTPAKNEYDERNATLWFHCQHRFPPDATTVEVKTKLPVSWGYHFPYSEDLFYCIQTGAGWKGRIGSEEVAIHFPDPVQPGQVLVAEPAGSIVEGDTVRWRFEDFEPKERDHDIHLQFVEPDVFPILADLRRESAEAPGDTHKELQLIKHLLALSSSRYTLPYPPNRIPPDEFREILDTLRSDRERAQFRTMFSRGKDGRYRQNSADWTQDAPEIVGPLSAGKYVPRQERTVFFLEGRDRLARFLEEHPHDADAWNLFLMHSIPAFCEWGVYPFQTEQIRRALRNCPDDPAVRLWDEVERLERRTEHEHSRSITPTAKRYFAKKEQLEETLRNRGVVDKHGGLAVRYPTRAADYYFGGE